MATQDIVQGQLYQALAALKSASLPWFDNNPYSSQGFQELFPGEGPSDWDLFKLLSYTFLGEVHGKIGTKLDVKPGTGKNGNTLTDNGLKNTPIDITIYLTTPQTLVNYGLFLKQVFDPSGKTVTKPIDIINPNLSLHGINSLYLYEVDLIRTPRDGEIASATLHFHPFTRKQPGGQVISTTPQSSERANVVPQASNIGTPPTPPVAVPPSSNIGPPPSFLA